MKKIDYLYAWFLNIVLFIISFNSGSLFTYLIFIFLTLILVISYVYPLLSFKNLEVVKFSSEVKETFKNSEFKIRFSIYNNSFLPVFF